MILYKYLDRYNCYLLVLFNIFTTAVLKLVDNVIYKIINKLYSLFSEPVSKFDSVLSFLKTLLVSKASTTFTWAEIVFSVVCYITICTFIISYNISTYTFFLWYIFNILIQNFILKAIKVWFWYSFKEDYGQLLPSRFLYMNLR